MPTLWRSTTRFSGVWQSALPMPRYSALFFPHFTTAWVELLLSRLILQSREPRLTEHQFDTGIFYPFFWNIFSYVVIYSGRRLHERYDSMKRRHLRERGRWNKGKPSRLQTFRRNTGAGRLKRANVPWAFRFVNIFFPLQMRKKISLLKGFWFFKTN